MDIYRDAIPMYIGIQRNDGSEMNLYGIGKCLGAHDHLPIGTVPFVQGHATFCPEAN